MDAASAPVAVRGKIAIVATTRRRLAACSPGHTPALRLRVSVVPWILANVALLDGPRLPGG